jgi:hypothetical protein
MVCVFNTWSDYFSIMWYRTYRQLSGLSLLCNIARPSIPDKPLCVCYTRLLFLAALYELFSININFEKNWSSKQKIALFRHYLTGYESFWYQFGTTTNFGNIRARTKWSKKGEWPKNQLILRITCNPHEWTTAGRVARSSARIALIVVVRVLTLVAHIRHQTARNTPKAPVGAGYWSPLITFSHEKYLTIRHRRHGDRRLVLKCGSLDSDARLKTCPK